MKNDLDIFGLVKSTGLDLLKDFGDKGLTEIAELFNKELLKDIPYLGTVINLATFGSNIKQFFLAKKLINFLSQLDSIPIEEREKFVLKLESSKQSKKIGEKLIVLIDNLDEGEKAIMLGKLFKKTIEGKIDVDTFNRLAISIKNIYYNDLIIFKKWNGQTVYQLHNDVHSSLLQNGFISLRINDKKIDILVANTRLSKSSEREPKLEFKISELGYIFLNNVDNV